MKQIETLVQDIYDLLGGKNPLTDLPADLADKFGQRMAKMISSRVLDQKEREPRLSPSNIGKPCERQVWLTINKPEVVEQLSPEAKMKFMYGDIIEELILFLAEASGHKVVGRQDVVEIEGIFGSRDVIIDGVLVDVKSASTYSFAKFRDGKLTEDDPFGYIGQIQTYLEASQNDPLLEDKDRCAFLVMDKTLGHICLDIHKKVPFDVREITRRKIAMVNSPDMPDRKFEPEEDGYTNPKTKQFITNGNLKLGMTCSYCSVKDACHDNLRTFIYKSGPVYFTKVVKEPNVFEVKKEMN